MTNGITADDDIDALNAWLTDAALAWRTRGCAAERVLRARRRRWPADQRALMLIDTLPGAGVCLHAHLRQCDLLSI
jgi:hypothetical protein